MTILVIGASRGIGLEFARQYRDLGQRVIATARDDAGLRQLRDLGALPIKLDVADPAAMAGLAAQLKGESLATALYVAGVFTTADAKQAPAAEEFDRAMRTNVLGAMQAIPQVAPLIEAGGRFGFLTSEMGYIGGVDSSASWVYRASKAALNMAVAAAQKDYPHAVMFAMSPGWVRTDMGGANAPMTAERSVTLMRQTLTTLTRKHRGAFLNYDGRIFQGW